MGYVASSTAEALRKTLQRLAADPSVDTEDPAFVAVKCALLRRIMELEVAEARTESKIHLVQIFEPPPADHAEAKTDDESAIA